MRPRQLGRERGVCAFCQHYTEHGHRLKLPESFTDYPYLQSGDVICEYCYAFLKDPRYRRRSWLIEAGRVTFLSRREAVESILAEHEPPFAIYVATRGKRHGWIPMIYAGVNWSAGETVNVGLEGYGVLRVERRNIRVILSWAELLKKRRVPLSAITNPSPRHIATLGTQLWRRLQLTKDWPEWLLLIA
ncbi:MAG: hypothetical protein DRJ96_07630 [Thermoprotei archaeon]|nr:MAG: hypothetical protein DRJ67_08620 [Thermoprotei archaeon]RLE95990.1 MAG: hypothetical protein DRJ96_07630 [Thermoprotei archaeon]